MSLTAVATVASGLIGGQAAEKFDPVFGLVYRFSLEIAGVKTTGWQSCTGLKVDFKPVEVRAGGGYDTTRFLPGEVHYPRVVLKRAVSAKDAADLQTWLGKKARAWLRGDEVTGEQATITLHDSYGKKVVSWKLANVRPAAWSGPDLDANTSKVALETLELVHEGFVVSAGDGQSTSQAGKPAKLTITGPGGTIEFKFPPTEIQVKKTQTPQMRLNNAGSNASDDNNQNEPTALVQDRQDTTTYTLNNLLIDGTDVVTKVRRLTRWATKSQQRAGQTAPVSPEIKFTWGQGFNEVQVLLTTLSATYTRFKADGTPIQAKINLTLEETAAEAAKYANPTSGGIPGRASHLFLASENLPELAYSAYGSPADWRTIAAANGFDDPLRVSPGTAVYLPAPSEMTA